MLKSIELTGFKSFGRKSELLFTSPIAAIVGPNGSGKSNVAEAFRFVLGEQSMKSMRSKKGEDLIWGGSQGLPRSNRAAVKVTFDNTSHALSIDFPEVIIERVVYRDGVNEYLINGSKVRLKDVSQLLAQANIGSSGYHIISQGEADRVLSASPRERREMVEEALGLKQYQQKKVESEKKLEETDANLHEVHSLRREIAPHLKYLEKQVEKIQKANELADELATKLGDYLSRENAYLLAESARLSHEEHEFTAQAQQLEQTVHATRSQLDVQRMESSSAEDSALSQLEHELAQARTAREEASRALGRAEGELNALKSVAAQPHSPEDAVAVQVVRSFVDELEHVLARALASDDPKDSKEALSAVQARIASFKKELGNTHSGSSSMGEAAQGVADRVAALSREFEGAQRTESDLEHRLAQMRVEEREGREAYHAAERLLIEEEGSQREVATRLAQVAAAITTINRERERFNDEVREGILLVGGGTLSFEKARVPDGALLEDRAMQESRRREIERLKIKIEEYRGVGADDVMKEYNETQERDAFLTRETEDLERSAAQLRQIIEELDANIEERFKGGITLIQKEFATFFTQLFGGGSATLELEKERVADGEDGEVVPAGIAVSVQLPRKQARGLEVLSGGERALTSIALIFAMSQVNPPPFLILDETDAALDEANSRRYAQIVESLAKRSQLILITHNRATMSAAGELYGVTMGQDGVSKLLSVKLEEAQAVAK